MKKMIAVAVILSCLSGPVFAASPWVSEPNYFKKSWQKLEYGLNNVILGMGKAWTEPMYYEGWNENFVIRSGKRFGLFLKGAVEGGLCVVGGVLQTFTFPIPVDIPIPGGGVPVQ